MGLPLTRADGSASVAFNYPTNFSSGERLCTWTVAQDRHDGSQEALNTSWNIPAYWTYRALREKGVGMSSYIWKKWATILTTTILKVYQWVGDRGWLPSTPTVSRPWLTVLIRKSIWLKKITAPDGKVVYEHKANQFRFTRLLLQRLCKSLMQGVLNSGDATTKSRIGQI